MNTPIKTPAELKAEQLKNAQNQSNENKTPETPENTNTSTPDETPVNNSIVEEEKRLREAAELKAKELEEENAKLKKEIAESNKKVITPESLEPKENDKIPEALNHDFFMLTGTDKSVSFGGFTFQKGEKYAVSGRIKNIVTQLVEKKLGKIIKD